MLDALRPALYAAPCILHSSVFRGLPKPPPGADAMVHYLGRARAYKIRLLLAADQTLAQRTGRPVKMPTQRQRNTARWLYALCPCPRRTAAQIADQCVVARPGLSFGPRAGFQRRVRTTALRSPLRIRSNAGKTWGRGVDPPFSSGRPKAIGWLRPSRIAVTKAASSPCPALGLSKRWCSGQIWRSR